MNFPLPVAGLLVLLSSAQSVAAPAAPTAADKAMLEAMQQFDTRKALKLVPSVNPAYTNELGKGWLHLLAQYYPEVPLYAALVARGVNVNAQDKYGETPLLAILAVFSGLGQPLVPEVARFLIAHGADVNLRASNQSPLERAIGHNDLPVIKLLLETGKVKVGEASPSGTTIAQSFVDKGCGNPATDGEIIDLLVAAGVDFGKIGVNHRSALQDAQQKPYCKSLIPRMQGRPAKR